MSWEIQLKINDEWRSIRRTRALEPYRYPDRASAEKILKICYPDQCRDIRLGAEPTVRVIESPKIANMDAY